jgi:beta-glucanase (GH16 family)
MLNDVSTWLSYLVVGASLIVIGLSLALYRLESVGLFFIRLSRRIASVVKSVKSSTTKVFRWMIRKIQTTLKKFSNWLSQLISSSWQFIAGVAFSMVAVIAVVIFSGVTLDIKPSEDSSGLGSLVAAVSSRQIVDPTRGWTYDFSEQPEGALDTKLWNIEDGPFTASFNGELQTYTNRTDNVRIEDGVLVLEAKPEIRDGKTYTSGRIDTQNTFTFTHGTLEVEAMLPRGVGTWPAAWLMPSRERYKASDFPEATDQKRLLTLNGELDFLESVGYQPGQNIPAAHTYNSLDRPPVVTPAFTTNPYDEYHRYGIIKTPSSIEFTLDGEVYARRDKISDDPLEWPFEQPYFLIINLALGGEWAGAYGIDDSSSPWQYKIKSINYSPLTATKS